MKNLTQDLFLFFIIQQQSLPKAHSTSQSAFHLAGCLNFGKSLLKHQALVC